MMNVIYSPSPTLQLKKTSLNTGDGVLIPGKIDTLGLRPMCSRLFRKNETKNFHLFVLLW